MVLYVKMPQRATFISYIFSQPVLCFPCRQYENALLSCGVVKSGAAEDAACGAAAASPGCRILLLETGGASSPSDVMTAASAVSSALSLFAADRCLHKGKIYEIPSNP